MTATHTSEIQRLSQLCIAYANMVSSFSGVPALESRRSAIENLLDQIKKELATVLHAQAKLVCDEQSGFETSEKDPGYLIRVGKNTPLYIPWFIVDDLPTVEVLDWLEDCATTIRTAGANTIGISGSTLFFGTLQCLSDLDFLEYEEDRERYPPTIQDPDGYTILKESDGYIEYVARTPFYGLIEITNKIVPLVYAKDGYGSSEGSHPYQEAPVKDTPRELEDPISLAKYLHHLSSQAVSYAHNDPTKSAKRLLPLARLVGDQKLADWIIDAFTGDELRSSLMAKQKTTLLRKINAKGVSVELSNEVKEEINSLRTEKASPTKLTDLEKKRVANLEGAINNKIAQIGSFLDAYMNFPIESGDT